MRTRRPDGLVICLQNHETMIMERLTNKVIAWYPYLNAVAAHPSRPLWVGVSGSEIHWLVWEESAGSLLPVETPREVHLPSPESQPRPALDSQPLGVQAEQEPTTPLEQIRPLLAQQRTDEALAVARAQPESDPLYKNAEGVCLLRQGHADQALKIFQTLVLDKRSRLRTDVSAPLISNGCIP